jgi:glycosyltransferase involved in cell wall biosynthesis
MTESRTPEVSVVIPTRNRRALLEQAVASVRAQAGVTWELIVVDDASDDDTAAYLADQPGLRFFRQPMRRQLSAARNVGLADARGTFILFLDDDDLLEPNALSVLSSALRTNEDAVAAIGARWDWFVEENWGRRDTHPRLPKKKWMYDEFLFGLGAVSGQNMYRTSVIRDMGGFDESVIQVEDRDMWLRISRLGPIVLRPETVMKYRITRNQYRPANIRELRDNVAQRSIDSLPADRRWRSSRIRQCAQLVYDAEDAMRGRKPVKAIRTALDAMFTDPGILLNPLIGTWVLARLARATARAIRPV